MFFQLIMHCYVHNIKQLLKTKQLIDATSRQDNGILAGRCRVWKYRLTSIINLHDSNIVFYLEQQGHLLIKSKTTGGYQATSKIESSRLHLENESRKQSHDKF